MGVAQRKLSQCATMKTVRTHQIEAYQQSEFVPGHKYRFLNALLCPYYKHGLAVGASHNTYAGVGRSSLSCALLSVEETAPRIAFTPELRAWGPVKSSKPKVGEGRKSHCPRRDYGGACQDRSSGGIHKSKIRRILTRIQWNDFQSLVLLI